MKTIWKAMVVAAFLCALCTVAYAAEGWVTVTSGENYDMNTRRFLFTRTELGNASVSSTVANGMTTTEPVSLDVPVAFSSRLYQNGVERTDIDYTSITDPGSYILYVTGSNGTEYEILTFTILNSASCALEGYSVPIGFTITDVLLDGTPISSAGSFVEFTEEGSYQVRYKCVMTQVEYELDVKVDHTPPTLALANVENGVAKGPVDISDVESGASIYITLNGSRIDYQSLLNSTGDYYIYLEDAAGNSTEYAFRIAVYFNVGSLGFFLLLLLVIAALIVYVVRVRKKTRVR